MSEFGFKFGSEPVAEQPLEGVSISPTWAWCYGLPHFDRGEPDEAVQFSCNTAVNSKLYVFEGEMWKLKVDAIIVGTNERMSERGGLNDMIFKRGGQTMLQECEKLKRIRTGTAAMTPAINLPSKYVIHAVGPKYADKYMTAAESTLHTAYRDALSITYDNQFRFVGISCIYLPHKSYPREAAAHVAIRTIRKFIENRGNHLHGVVICLETEEDSLIYSRLLPCYFPRSASEETLQLSLVGSGSRFDAETGACLIEGRGIRIASTFGSVAEERMVEVEVEVDDDDDDKHDDVNPLPGDVVVKRHEGEKKKSTFDDQEDLINEFTGNVMSKSSTSTLSDKKTKKVVQTRQWVKSDQSSSSSSRHYAVSNDFTNLAPSPDEVRLQQRKVEYSTLSEEDKVRRIHHQWIATALNDDDMDFFEFDSNHVIYQGGVDVDGRPIICVVGTYIPGLVDGPIKSSMLINYIMKVMEKVIRRPLDRLIHGKGLRCCDLFNLIYFHGNVSDRNEPDDDWLSKVMTLFNYRYKVFMHAFYLCHWSVGLRFHLWAVLPSIVDPFWENEKDYGPIESYEHVFSKDDDDEQPQGQKVNNGDNVGDALIVSNRQVQLSYIDNLAELVQVMNLPSEDHIWLPAIVRAYDNELKIT